MKRILRHPELLVAVGIVLALTTGCPRKEGPGPAPEPTPQPTIVVAPEPTPNPGPVCYVADVPRGTPPVCKNASGGFVTCPADTSPLPPCD